MNENTKYKIIMQGITSSNVAETCKEHGISRTIYYKWYRAYTRNGMDGLANHARRKPVMPNKVDNRTMKIIMDYVAKFPEDGPRRICYELQDEGIKVGESGIYNVLKRNGLSRRDQREAYANQLKVKKRQYREAGRKRGCHEHKPVLDYAMKSSVNAHPGYICLQSIHYMGNFPKLGRIYQYAIYDVYSKVGLVKLYNRKASIHVIEFMRMRLLPVMKTFGFRIENLITGQGREFVSNWDRSRHQYSAFLEANQIRQVALRVEDQVFGPIKDFTEVLTKEFYQQAWVDEQINSFDALSKKLDEYMKYYNFRRVITDGPHQGRIPADIVLDYLGNSEAWPLWVFTRRQQ